MADLPFAIADIHIRDFRGIDDLKMSFCGPDGKTPNELVVIAGPNGTGKTTVLEACLMISGYHNLVRGPIDDAAIRVSAENYQITGTIHWSDTTEEVKLGAFDHASKWDRCVYYSSRRTNNLIGSVGVTTGPDVQRLPELEENRLGIVKQYLTNARLFELFPSEQSQENGGYGPIISSLNEAWQSFYPRQNFSLEPAGTHPSSGFDLYLNSDKASRLSVDKLSSGQLELLVFMASLLTWSATSGLIVIDEPELHLDADWHRSIIGAIQKLKPRCQLIVATHSPDIYDSATSYERHFLVENDDIRARIWDKVRQNAVGDAVDAP